MPPSRSSRLSDTIAARAVSGVVFSRGGGGGATGSPVPPPPRHRGCITFNLARLQPVRLFFLFGMSAGSVTQSPADLQTFQWQWQRVSSKARTSYGRMGMLWKQSFGEERLQESVTARWALRVWLSYQS